MKYVFIIIALILLSEKANATHLVGGNLGYEYIGQFGGNYRYKIILTTYTDCAPPSNFQNGPEQTIADIGVYEHDLQNSPLGGGPVKNFTASVNMTLVLVERIDPNIPNGCTIGTGTCIDKAVYEGFIDLPLNFSGYHIFYERCCRNGTIVNLIPDESMSFHAYISPPLLENSSPVFTDDPVPFLCAGDTTTLLNSAIDPDGDMLVFSFVQPYDAQVSSNTDPAPGPPPSLNWTINTVTYAGGYNLAQPFGVGGYTSINASTGLTTYYPPATGDYVIAVEIKEYRNGNLIGVTRRDLQVLVLTCPLNPAPNIDPTAGTTSSQFTIEEGETLCFDFGYDDPNGDSLILLASGTVFDINIVNPNATINQPVTGLDTVSTEFCWTTACGQAQSLPYQFQVSVMDNGCPPKTTNSVYQITVNPVPPPTAITGDPVVCQFSTDTYTTQNIPNTTYNWTITGGNIVANNGSSIDIQWTAPGTGTISLIAENQFGCLSEPISQDVTVTISPTTDAGPDTTICFGDTASLVATTDALAGFTASWTPNANMINATTLAVNVFPTDTTKYFILINLGGGCFALDSVTVNVNIPFISAGFDTSICSGDSVQLNGSSSIGIPIWTPVIGLSDDAILNPFASPIVSTEYLLTLIDGLGCSITDTVNVNVDQAFTLTTNNDTTICLGDCANLSATGATTYAWEPTVNDSTLSNPTACPTATETYFVYGATGACRDTAQVTVTINTLTTVVAGLDVAICEGDSIQLNASGAAAYLWSPADSITDVNIDNPFVFPSNTTEYIVIGTNTLGCADADSIIVTVNPLPFVDAGEDTSICFGDSVQLNGSSAVGITSWTPVTDLNDPSVLNPFASPTATTEYFLTLTDGFGCSSTDTMEVNIEPAFSLSISNDTTICLGDSANLSASGANIYAWEPAISLTDSSLSNPIAFPAASETYFVYGATGVCRDTAHVTVTINTLTTVDAGLDVAICEGDSIQLNASGAAAYLWSPADSITDVNIDNPFVFPSNTTEYIVIGTNALGCADADSIIVTVNPLPFVDAGEDTSICFGDSVQLNGSSAVGITSWTPVTDLSDPSVLNPFASPTATTEYFLILTDGFGCSSTDTMEVNIEPAFSLSISNDTTICLGDSANISASGANTYAWEPAISLTDSSLSNPIAFPVASETYFVYGATGVCRDTAHVTVTINTLTTVDAGLDVAICEGDSIQLNASGAAAYLWSPADSITDINIANPFVFPSNTTEYIVTGTDGLGCIDADSIILTVNPLPIVDAGEDLWVCPGDNIQLNGSGIDTPVWTPITGLSDPNIYTPISTPPDTISYILTVTDINLCTLTDTMTVYVNQNVPTDAGNDTTICFGDSVVIGGNPTAIGGTIYAWTPANLIVDPSVSNPNVFPSVTTTFYVTTTNDTCSGLDSVIVNVNLLPIIDAGNDVQICIGDSAQLLATGGVGYLWTPSTTLTDDTIANPMAFPTDTTEYIVNAIDINGCASSDTVSVIVNPLPSAFAGNDVAICFGDTTTLTATGGLNYSWSPTDSLSNPLNDITQAFPIITTEYIVTVTDTNGCIQSDSIVVTVNELPIGDAVADVTICNGDSTQLNATGGDTYVWTPITDLSDPNIADPWATSIVTTNYSVLITDINGCMDTDTVLVTVNNLPNISAGSDIQICIGDTTQLLVTGGDTYLWTPETGLSNDTSSNPTVTINDTTEYIVTGTDINGCINSDTISVIINPFPNVSAGNDINICIGETTQLTATGGESYNWTNGLFLDDNLIFNPNATPDTTMEFIVTVTDSNTCINTDSVIVSVFIIEAISDQSICLEDSVQLDVFGSIGNAYTWTPSTYLSDPNIANPYSTAQEDIIYYVSVSDVQGCSDQDSVVITVLSIPTASFTPEIEAGCEGVVVKFTNTSIDGFSFDWLFGDGGTTTDESPTYAFPYGEDFTATLTVTNTNGCIDNSTFSGTALDFDDYFDIFIPNVFTPNGDGENDIFAVEVAGELNKCSDLKIYNRWGQIIFISTGGNTKWDGHTNVGQAVPEGTYFFVVEINGIMKSGSVAVFR